MGFLYREKKGPVPAGLFPVNVLPVKYLRSAVRRLGLVKQLIPKKYLLPVINYICCEAHLDITAKS
jgi:hypothetical protein